MSELAVRPDETPEQAAQRLGLPVSKYQTPGGPVVVIGRLSAAQIESAHREIARLLRRHYPELFQTRGVER